MRDKGKDMIALPVEERLALQDLMTSYCHAVDRIGDIDGLLAHFTPDAVLDFSAIGLPLMHGHGDIRAFFASVFADMTHHAHFISNFRALHYDGESATMTAYVIGMGHARSGNSVKVEVTYSFDCVKLANGMWQCRRYTIKPLMPLPGSLAEIHGERSQ